MLYRDPGWSFAGNFKWLSGELVRHSSTDNGYECCLFRIDAHGFKVLIIACTSGGISGFFVCFASGVVFWEVFVLSGDFKVFGDSCTCFLCRFAGLEVESECFLRF